MKFHEFSAEQMKIVNSHRWQQCVCETCAAFREHMQAQAAHCRKLAQRRSRRARVMMYEKDSVRG